MRTLLGIGLFSATVLLFQVTLTRLFSVAQFYHFAFLVVSLALLGFGASGSLLAVWPRLRSIRLGPVYVLLFAPTTVIAYVILNRWAFDSYAIAWDRAQVWRLLANLFCLAVPFTFAGAVVGVFLSHETHAVGRIYGANMIGSAVGAAVTPLLLVTLGNERIIVLCSALAAASALMLMPEASHKESLRVAAGVGLVISVLGLVAPPQVLDLIPSPYKALSHFQRNPDATLDAPRYNAYSRLDIVRSDTIHSAPGLSMSYFSAPPPEIGLLIDGDNLMPVVKADSPAAFAQAMPAAVAFALVDDPAVLVLGAGGGFDAWIAVQNGAASAVAVEANNLIVDALRDDLRAWSGLADDPRVTLVHSDIRTYARQSDRQFDVVQIALTDTYRPVTSGAFTLNENYTLTVEAFESYLDRLADDGLFVFTRWLQNPPSEDVRALALIVEALEAHGLDPVQHIAAFRTLQTVTFLVKKVPFTPDEIAQITNEAERLLYDMVLPPDVLPEAINRFARLETPVYHEIYTQLLTTDDREAFYADYVFDVRPSTDNHPFFFHYFTWGQTPEILDNLGRTWQPFGGSGYFVLVALLFFAVGAALVFVVLPIALRPQFRRIMRDSALSQSARILIYFGALGLAFLLIEIATIQQFVLVLGQPTLTIATVLGTLLLFSGIGSWLSDRLVWSRMLIALVLLVLVWPWITRGITAAILPLPLTLRWILSVLTIAPLGLLMGIPFASGLTAIRHVPDLVPWAWAINGGASVVSAVLAALLALSFGFYGVLWIGGALYGIAWIRRPDPSLHA